MTSWISKLHCRMPCLICLVGMTLPSSRIRRIADVTSVGERGGGLSSLAIEGFFPGISPHDSKDLTFTRRARKQVNIMLTSTHQPTQARFIVCSSSEACHSPLING